jgi:catechol 2,3-dioxygenase-like lactoylglutathione lyase family enzyme
MFKDIQAFSGYSISDPEATRTFYGNVLGMDIGLVEGMGDFGALELRIAGGRPVLLYPKPDHQPSTYTVLNFPVDDINKVVDELADKGIETLRYDGGIKQDEKGIARGISANMGPDIAWITDPSGNILAILQNS